MPALGRPNAPKKLPSGIFDSPRFQSSPVSGEVQTSASVSPKTLFTQRKNNVLSPGYLRYQVDSQSSPKGYLQHEGISTSTALDSIAPGVRRKSTLSGGKSPDSSVSEPSSARSSISAKAKKLLNIPSLRVAGVATKDGAPPRDAKHGFHWQREISGHWLEIRMGRREPHVRSPATLPSSSSGATTEVSPPEAIFSHSVSHNSVKVSTQVSTSTTNTVPPSPQPSSKSMLSTPQISSSREAFVERTKRRLHLKRVEREMNMQPNRTMTDELLERTSHMLHVVAAKRSKLSVSPTISNSSSQESSNRSGHTPKWQRILGDHAKNGGSSSSSTRSTALGKVPESTPEPGEMYTASDQQQYFRVEMTDASGPNFLPSEAKRINTPPIGGRTKHRGFFFDYKPPPLPREPSFRLGRESRVPTDHQDDSESHSKSRRVSGSEWYNVQLDAIDAEEQQRKDFVNEVPDHFPNSPLCPRHPKHKSGGKGTCPIHGKDEPMELEKSGREHSEVHEVEY